MADFPGREAVSGEINRGLAAVHEFVDQMSHEGRWRRKVIDEQRVVTTARCRKQNAAQAHRSLSVDPAIQGGRLRSVAVNLGSHEEIAGEIETPNELRDHVPAASWRARIHTFAAVSLGKSGDKPLDQEGFSGTGGPPDKLALPFLQGQSQTPHLPVAADQHAVR